MQCLPLLAKKLTDLSPDRNCDPHLLRILNDQTRALQAAVAELQAAVRRNPTAREDRNSAARFGQAERYCALHSAICCLGFWLFNREHLGDFVTRGEWLIAALARQGEAIFRCGTMNLAWTENLCRQLYDQTEHFQMYSLMPWPLAQPGQGEQNSDGGLFPPLPEDP